MTEGVKHDASVVNLGDSSVVSLDDVDTCVAVELAAVPGGSVQGRAWWPGFGIEDVATFKTVEHYLFKDL